MSRRVFLSRRVLALVAAIAPGLGCGAVLGLDDLKDRNTQTSDGGETDADRKRESGDEGEGGPDTTPDATAPPANCHPPGYFDPVTGKNKAKPGC